MQSSTQAIRVGLFFILGAILIWMVYQALTYGAFFRERGYEINAYFEDLKQLRVGDDVRMAGVRIGSVQSTGLRERQAFAVLVIESEIRIPEDSVATVAIAGLLGTNFLSVSMGQSDMYLAEKGTIQTEHTPALDEIFSALGDVGSKLEDLFGEVSRAMGLISGTDEESGLLQNLNELIADNRESLSRTLANVETVTEKLVRGEGTLGKLLSDDEAYNSLLAVTERIEGAANEATLLMVGAQEIVDQIKSGRGTIGSLLYDDEISNEILLVTRNLREVSDRLTAGEGTLGRLLVDDTLYNEAQVILRKAERAIDGLGDQGPITAVGIAASALF